MNDIRMTRARAALLLRHAFFGSLAMRLQIIETTGVKTMAVDGKRLAYNPSFLDTMDPDETEFVVAHEIVHCALGHHTRRNSRDHDNWNKACDYVVNAILQKSGCFKVKADALLDPQFDNLSAEAVYRILDQQSQQQQSQSSNDDDEGDDNEDQDAKGDVSDDDDQGNDAEDQSGDGEDNDTGSSPSDGEGDSSQSDNDGNGDADGDVSGDQSEPSQGGSQDEGESDAQAPQGRGDPGNCGEVLDAAPEHDQAAIDEQRAEWEIAVRQAANISKRQGEGKLPGFVEEIVGNLETGRTNWRDVLRRFVEPSTTKDYSWSMPNRRFVSAGYFVPGTVSDGVNHVALIVDSSYSIDSDLLLRFGSECQAALDDGAIDKITLIFCDTRVTATREFGKGDVIDFSVPGRGGTAFSPAFKWVTDNAPDVAAAIYFTDLECSDYGDEPHYPVLWAAYGDPRRVQELMTQVPFGECVEIAMN